MRTRTRAALLVTGLVAATAGLGAAPAGAAEVGARIQTFMNFGYTPGPGGGLVLDWGFEPATATVQRGQAVRLHVPQGQEPHTFTVVNEKNVPDTIDEIFNCGLCNEAGSRHDPDGNQKPPFVTRVNAGAVGLDRQGDSRLVLTGATVYAQVTAPRGSTLHYICAIHPWMHGKIRVT